MIPGAHDKHHHNNHHHPWELPKRKNCSPNMDGFASCPVHIQYIYIYIYKHLECIRISPGLTISTQNCNIECKWIEQRHELSLSVSAVGARAFNRGGPWSWREGSSD